MLKRFPRGDDEPHNQSGSYGAQRMIYHNCLAYFHELDIHVYSRDLEKSQLEGRVRWDEKSAKKEVKRSDCVVYLAL